MRVRVLSKITDVDSFAWDACTQGDPFVSHAFLRTLEATGCVTPKQGWTPTHVVLEDDGQVVGAAPAYWKAHSFGEYVFDWAWADAHHRLGIEYYPKLQCCVPFTPATGPRLLVREGADAGRIRSALASALVAIASETQASSLHVTFPTRAEWDFGQAAGLLRRSGIQYHWPNDGYRTFDDFLASLLGRKKRQLVRERRDANAAVRIETLRGDRIREEHWNAFHGFYRDTIARKGGQAYLTPEFFDALGGTMGDRVVLVVARDGARIVAAALNLLGTQTLFGRYWGASVDVPFLHFELCYYRAIELAIELGLERVEAGAQGEHKIARGYVPIETYSLHWVADPRLQQAVADYLERERTAVLEHIDALAAESPYRERRAKRP